jgi:serine-type D-Ala-D-Ala carboxypeptidase (penicillin-binding protein 5/6)
VLSATNLAKSATALVMFTIMLFTLSGAVAGDQAGAQETTSGKNPSSKAAVPDTPTVDAEAWALTDLDSGMYLEGDNPDEQLPIGSTTKIMSALVVLEEGVDPDEEVTISKDAESYVGNTYSNVGLIAGERLTVRDLLTASLVASGTDAVYALAEHVGNGSVDNFVEKMNDQASSMGLQNTHFDTPAGLDTPGNYSSVRDLATTTQAAFKYPLFAQIVDTKDATINSQNRQIEIHNTNQLLSTYPKATGVKTGTTPEAGANLVASAADGGESYIAVVLDDGEDPARFQDSRSILEYGFNRYERQTLVRQDEVYKELSLPYRRGETVELAAAQDVTGPVDANSQVERRVTTKELPAQAEAGQELGLVDVLVDGQSVGHSPLVAREGYEEASLWNKIWYSIQGLWAGS